MRSRRPPRGLEAALGDFVVPLGRCSVVGVRPRWDGDERGHGIADARPLIPGARELLAALGETGWVAEQPELHLRPHVEDWCERDQRLALVDAHVDGQGAYILDVEWRGGPWSLGQARAAVLRIEFRQTALGDREGDILAVSESVTPQA